MSNYAFNYAFNISGNCNAAVAEISENVAAMRERTEAATQSFTKLQQKLILFNQASDYFSAMQGLIFMTLFSLLDEIEPIGIFANVETDDSKRKDHSFFPLKEVFYKDSYNVIQKSCKRVEMHEILASVRENRGLNNSVVKYFNKIENSFVGDEKNESIAAVCENSFNCLSVFNNKKISIKEALSQCGMAAKAAGVSFAETNAAIQVLDKAGKKGSEGGVALRNVMSTLAQGRFLPKDVREELAAAGVDINKLTDKSKSLSERLTLLKPVMADSALFSKLFGKENANAAMALVQGIDTVDKWTDAISGTNTAVDQSKIVMETYNEKMARVRASFDDMNKWYFDYCNYNAVMQNSNIISNSPLIRSCVEIIYKNISKNETNSLLRFQHNLKNLSSIFRTRLLHIEKKRDYCNEDAALCFHIYKQKCNNIYSILRNNEISELYSIIYNAEQAITEISKQCCHYFGNLSTSFVKLPKIDKTTLTTSYIEENKKKNISQTYIREIHTIWNTLKVQSNCCSILSRIYPNMYAQKLDNEIGLALNFIYNEERRRKEDIKKIPILYNERRTDFGTSIQREIWNESATQCVCRYSKQLQEKSEEKKNAITILFDKLIGGIEIRNENLNLKSEDMISQLENAVEYCLLKVIEKAAEEY